MLDAVAGYVVRRIKARHTNAVTRPQDLAGLLQAFAALRHNSVAIPELLSAVGEQVGQAGRHWHEALPLSFAHLQVLAQSRA
jgi:hypothetical protein